MCKGKKCLGKNETNKLNFLERKWHRKSDIMNARRWDLFQFAYFTTNLCTSPPWQMREDRRLIFIPELWKRNKEKFQSVTLKNWDLFLKGLCLGCLIHFVSYALMPSMRPYSLWNLKKYLWMTKSLLRVKQNLSPKHHINGYNEQKWTLKNC